MDAGSQMFRHPPAPTPEEVAEKMRADQAQQPRGLAPANPETNLMTFPAADPRVQPADGSAPYQFPFQVGDRPQDAKELNLEALQARLLQRDHQVQLEEEAAIQRMETEGA
jgi:hypothetical protein